VAPRSCRDRPWEFYIGGVRFRACWRCNGATAPTNLRISTEHQQHSRLFGSQAAFVVSQSVFDLYFLLWPNVLGIGRACCLPRTRELQVVTGASQVSTMSGSWEGRRCMQAKRKRRIIGFEGAGVMRRRSKPYLSEKGSVPSQMMLI